MISSILRRVHLKELLKRPELLFCIVGLLFGLLFIFHLAPLSGTDEFTHFPRLYQISEGTLWEQRLTDNQYGGSLPVNINTMVNDYRNLSRYPTGESYLAGESQLNATYSRVTNPGNRKATAIFTSTVTYPPWAYAASLIGLLVAKAMHLPLIWYVYLARLSSLVVWLILGYFAIKLLPSGKWFVTVLALTPTALSQAATVGSDGLLMGLVWLLTAMVLAVSLGKTPFRLSWMALILLIALYSTLIKDGYFLIGLLPLAIPMSRFRTKRLAITFKALDLFSVTIVALLFTLHTIHAVKGVTLTPTIGMNFNSSQQITYIMHNVPKYLWSVLEQPFTKSFDTTYLGTVGIISNRLIYLSVLVIGIIYACLGITYAKTQPIENLKKISKFMLPFFLAIFFATYLLLASAFYIGNTSVGAQFVNGFYGRYFLPIIPLLLVIPMSLKQHKSHESYLSATVVGSVIGLVAMVCSLQ